MVPEHEPDGRNSHLKRRLIALVLCIAVLLLLALAWSGGPLRNALHALQPAQLLAQLQAFGASAGPLVLIAAFALALTLAVPLSLLTLLVIAAMGPLPGCLYALAGALAGATISHGIGRLLGHEALRRLGGPRVNQLSDTLGRRGLLAVIGLRLMPIAPFAVVNMVAGATHIRLRDMLLGTAIGMSPSTLVMAFFLDRITAALAHPGPLVWGLVVLGLCLVLAGTWLFRRWLRRNDLLACPSAPAVSQDTDRTSSTQ
ncbi:TVP38/TMEM64 family protein [Roseateles koreensis]|uniref:TVP38/TMEM64 family membrane protein n=1 Tax=Roseateles koreensis TaxID=2987526 RepID=A0ABT5KSX8_9BURK|nr:VTT domain-containing protein [Roseateles koreensis]MDC8786015.1 VTT domain-containing protein [Roseateles koreensis]